jgi:hypothetical protein
MPALPGAIIWKSGANFRSPPRADPRSGHQVLDLTPTRADRGLFHGELRKEDYLKSGDGGVAA